MYTAPTYFATGVGRSILSNRVSYVFDWHGPSITMVSIWENVFSFGHALKRELFKSQ